MFGCVIGGCTDRSPPAAPLACAGGCTCASPRVPEIGGCPPQNPDPARPVKLAPPRSRSGSSASSSLKSTSLESSSDVHTSLALPSEASHALPCSGIARDTGSVPSSPPRPSSCSSVATSRRSLSNRASFRALVSGSIDPVGRAGTADRRRLLLRKAWALVSDSATAGQYNKAPPGSHDSSRTGALWWYNLCATHALRCLPKDDGGGWMGRRTAPRSSSSGWRAGPPRVGAEPREATCLGADSGGVAARRGHNQRCRQSAQDLPRPTQAPELGRQPHSAAASHPPDDQPQRAPPNLPPARAAAGRAPS